MSIVIIVLLILVLITVVWSTLSKLITEKTSSSEEKAELFGEQINILAVLIDPENESQIFVSLQKPTGTITSTETEEIIGTSLDVDIISVADLSGSMRACEGVSIIECYWGMDGRSYNWAQSICYGILKIDMVDCVDEYDGTLVDGLTPTQDANKELVDLLFENENSEGRMGLSGYSSETVPAWSSNLTNDDQALKDIIDSWEAFTSTCICCGINDAVNKLQNSPPEKSKTIIVMSDGEATKECDEQNTGDPGQDAIEAACDAYNEFDNLIIYSVGLGGNVDQEVLERIAKDCGEGQNFSAQDLGDLIEIYQEIGSQIKTTFISETQVSFIRIIFTTATNSAYKDVIPPELLVIERYTLDLSESGLTDEILKVEIYPVVVDDSGKETIGPLFDAWESK